MLGVRVPPSQLTLLLRGRAVVARQAHNLKVVGSIPTPATMALSNNWFSSPAFQVGNSGSSPDSATNSQDTAGPFDSCLDVTAILARQR